MAMPGNPTALVQLDQPDRALGITQTDEPGLRVALNSYVPMGEVLRQNAASEILRQGSDLLFSKPECHDQ